MNHFNNKGESIVAVVLIIVLTKKKDVYRTIMVNSVDGTAPLTRDSEVMDVVAEMRLFSGDRATVNAQSLLDLLADTDKHIVAKENTSFSIEATGSETNGNITIHLEKGDALFTIDNKLDENATFEVKSPNATISVRGTTFEVVYDPALRQTHVIVTEGVVKVSTNIEEATLNAGEDLYVVDDAIVTDAADAGSGSGAGEDASGTADADSILSTSDVVFLCAAALDPGSDFMGESLEELNTKLNTVFAQYDNADAIYALVSEKVSEEEIDELTGMTKEEYTTHLTEVMDSVKQNGGFTESEYELLLTYIEDCRRSADMQLCSTVQTAVKIVLHDPMLMNTTEAEIPSNGEYTLAEIYGHAGFGAAVADIIGFRDAAETESHLLSAKAAGGHIVVVIEGTTVTAYCDQDETIRSN